MICIRLTPEQRHALEQARRLRTSHLAERCLLVLLSDRGQRVPAIAQSMGRPEHTLRSWLKASMRGGSEGLTATPPSGRTNRKAQAARALLAQVIPRSPRDYGDLEAGWSTNVWVDSLQRQDVMASASPGQRALKRGGWVYKRFAKTIPAHAPSAAEKQGGWTSSSEQSLPRRGSMRARSCS